MKAKMKNKLIVYFLTLIILIDFMGMATVVVLFPKLLLGNAGIFPPYWSDRTRLMMMGVMLALYPLGQVIGASILGKLSDYHGRRKILLLTLLGTLLGFSLSGLSVVIKSAALMFVSRLVAGLCAGNVAIAQASLMDVSTPETKAKNISFSQIAMGSAYIVGPILGAWLSEPSVISWFSMSTPFWFFSAVLLVLFSLTLCFYPETNLERKKEKIYLLESVQQIYLALTSKKVSSAFTVWLIFVSGWWLFESFMPAYLLQKFSYNTMQIGHVLAFNGALYAAFQFFVVQRLAKSMQPSTMIAYFTVISGIAIISLSFVTSTLQVYLAMSVFVMAMGFAIPGIITHISNLADKTDQGQVMGMINSIQAVSTVLVMITGGYLNAIHPSITVIGGGALVIFSWISFIAGAPKKPAFEIKASA